MSQRAVDAWYNQSDDLTEVPMSEAARPEPGDVVDMLTYMRETLAVWDANIAEMQARRHEMAVRIAVMESATDPAVLDAATEHEERVAEGRPYEDAQDAEELLTEAHRRYGG